MNPNAKYDEQPGFVTVQFNRIQSRGTTLFGSSIKHDHLISLTIRKGNVRRDLNQDWIHGGDEMIEVWLSSSQYAELLTTMNYGSGVPGTLKHVHGTPVPEPVIESKHKQFEDELKNDIEEVLSKFKDTLKQANALLSASKPLTKGEKEDLLSGIHSFERLMNDHLPFLVKQFTEQMDKTTIEAKAEVEGFVNHIVNATGLKVLQDQVKTPVMIEEKGKI